MNVYKVNSFSIADAGNGKGFLGDINGDGRMEVVFVQADSGIDDRYVPHQVTCVTAYDLTGRKLWQTGDPTGTPGGFGSDFPAQIYDYDMDGALEVICVMNKRFTVLEGSTGRIKKEYPLPAEEAHDCIIIANLTGTERPGEIILKDRYFNMWAMDRDFNVMWTHHGNIGHFPYAYDINGDGYDEIMAGYDCLDHNGKIMWSCHDLEDHADCIWVGDVNGDGRPEIAVGGSVTCLYSADGRELWRYDGSVESQHIALGRFIPGAPGLQIAGLDRIRRGDGYKGQWDGKDGLFLIDCNGKEIIKEDRKTKGWLTIAETLSNWNGDGKDHILAYRREGGVNPGLYDRDLKMVAEFPKGEGKGDYVLHGDLFGRGIEDVIVYGDKEAVIYSGTYTDVSETPKGNAIPQPKRLYSVTLYPGGCIEN